jgi:hypothetical protein
VEWWRASVFDRKWLLDLAECLEAVKGIGSCWTSPCLGLAGNAAIVRVYPILPVATK